jgi:nucleotide-binding universal stress UspA family protein
MKILIPLDFTPVTENALRYSIGLIKTLGVSELILFHVISSDRDKESANKKLQDLVVSYKSQGPIPMNTLVRSGNIFDQIGSVAQEVGASLIVMATHGIKGMQHIIGSRAMRVITNSETPYIVIQQKPYKEVKKILVPVDFTRESKQLLPLLESIGSKFKAELFLVRQKSKDEFIENRINNNFNYISTSLKDSGIPFSEAGYFTPSSRYKDILNQSEETGTDLIVTTIDPETNITDYIMGVEEQKIVANESQTPVLCIHIKHFMKKSGSFFE